MTNKSSTCKPGDKTYTLKIYMIDLHICLQAAKIAASWRLPGFLLLLTFISSGLFTVVADDFIPPKQAFQVSAKAVSPNKVNLTWNIADDCYLYKHRFKIESATPGIQVIKSEFPEGQDKTDHIYGKAKIFKKEVSVDIDLLRTQVNTSKLYLNITFQGCTESGICYMPERKVVTINLPGQPAGQQRQANTDTDHPALLSEQDSIAETLNHKPAWFVISSFFGFGLLLAFTPCVFPMLPIISGIIAGHGVGINQRKAFALSSCYVLASALTYTVFGVMAGLFGSNLQAILQTPWVIAVFSGIFVLLAFSMFGLFELQMPGFLQSKLAIASGKQRGGSYLGAGMMGALSALIIGPCVTAPLAGALLYISQTGDAMLGGVALFALGLGMGVPLLGVGAFAGKYLPKAGSWMQAVKGVFGIGLLAVAIWLLSRVIPPFVSLILWLFLASLPVFLLAHHRRWRLAGFATVAYGMVLWLGWSGYYSSQIPGMVCEAVQTCEAKLLPGLAFRQVNSLEDVLKELESAGKANKPVVLDFYADWCSACVELKYTTFADTAVHQALSEVVLLQADVTQNSRLDKDLLRHFNLIGPPAILFFDINQQEVSQHRIIGYMDAKRFLDISENALQMKR